MVSLVNGLLLSAGQAIFQSEWLTRFLLASQTPLAWAEKSQPLLMRLTPTSRAAVLMALLALLLVGIGLVALTVVWGRGIVRKARQTHGPTPRLAERWYQKPLVPPVSDQNEAE